MVLPTDFAYYEIFRATTPTGPFTLIGTSTSGSFTDLTAVLGTVYYYRVVTVDIYGNRSVPSSTINIVFNNEAISGLITDFAYYEIYRSNQADGVFSLIGTSITEDFVDSTAVLGNTYCYKVVTVDIYGNRSEPSTVTCVFFSIQGPTPDGGQQTIVNPTAILSRDNVVCVYREGDADSLSSALRYKEIHGLEDNQLIAIPCSNREVLSDYIEFQEEVEDPIRTAITNYPVSDRSVYAIILMPYVPGGFRDGSDVISSTSRLSRLFYPFEKNSVNPIYNRQVFKRFDGFDALQALICTRIDGPNIVTAPWFDNIEIAKGRSQVGGKFYFDPYSAYSFAGASDYSLDLLNFRDNYLERLGLATETTSQSSPSRDPFFSQVEGDSFFWGWGADRGSLNYFQTTAETRAFFYNADFDGGFSIRNLDARSWPILAIRQGYVAAAGSMSGTNAYAFLRPVPFMDALFRGATMGEAMFFSQPLINSPIACFGDPLASFAFPVPFTENTLLSPSKAWDNMENCLAEAVACIYRKTKVLDKLRTYVASGSDEFIQEELIYPFDQLSAEFDDLSWKNDFVQLTGKLVNFVVDRNATAYDFAYPNLNQYLTYTETKISSIVLETLQNQSLINSIMPANIEIVGSWNFETTLEHYPGDFRFYHFELQIAKEYDDFDKGNILISKDTFADITNWYFEDYNGNFQPFSGNGITSNYEDKKIRYVNQSSELLVRGEFYWFRVRQKDELQEFGWRYSREIVYL